MLRCEHNCHLCKNEFLGRCHVTGNDVSVKDTPVCDDYNYGGSAIHLQEILYAEKLGVKELNEEQQEEIATQFRKEIKEGIRNSDGLTEKEFLERYKPSDYARPSVTVDMMILGMNKAYDKLKILLIQRGNHPYMNCWALPGGFVDINESTYHAAQRELEEETGLTNMYMEQLYTMSQPDRDPRMRVIDVAYIALTNVTNVKAGDDAKNAVWCDIELSDNKLKITNEDCGINICYNLVEKEFKNGVLVYKNYVPELDSKDKLAFDHAEIILEGLMRMRNKVQYTDIAFNLMSEEFTLSDLQAVYEVIMGTNLYKKNFRDKIKDKIVDTEKKGKSVVGNKISELYRYKQV